MSTWERHCSVLLQIKQKFQLIAKRIIKTNVTSNIETRNTNKTELIATYNEFLICARKIWDSLDLDQREVIISQFQYFRDRLIRAFAILQCSCLVPSKLFTLIDVDVTDPDAENINIKMAQSPLDFIKLAASIVKPFSGNPQNLDTFLNSVNLLENLTDNTNQNLLIPFIKTRLEDRALDYVPANPASVIEITNALKASIKRNPSSLIESKLDSLKLKSLANLDEFVQCADKLAHELRSTMITEGCTPTKADEMVKSKVTKLCRDSAITDTIKTIMACGSFNTYMDVLTKFSSEMSNVPRSSQILQYHTFNKRGQHTSNNTRYPHNTFNFARNSHPNYRPPKQYIHQYIPNQNRTFYRAQFQPRNNNGPYIGGQRPRHYAPNNYVRFYQDRGNEEAPAARPQEGGTNN